jgi:cysteine-rich repeat protein
VPRAVELCEILRVKMTVPSARWDNDVCATEFLRRGLRDGDAAVAKNEAIDTVRDAVHDSLAEFDENHESTVVPSVCGDGELITEFGEECDDGNLDNGDGCDNDCQIE